MKLIITALTLLGTCSIWSQEVISSQGDSYSAAGASIDFTIGEVVINTVSAGGNDLTQGFHQTHWYFASIEDLAPEWNVQVFPNPMGSVLTIQTGSPENMNYSLYDAQGRIVRQGNLISPETEVDVQTLAPGAYELRLANEQSALLRNFTLIKHF